MTKQERDEYVAQSLHLIELHDAERRPDRFDYLGDPDELIRHRGVVSGLRVA